MFVAGFCVKFHWIIPADALLPLFDGLYCRLQAGLKLDEIVPVFRQVSGRQVSASSEALQVLGAGINGEAVYAVPIRSGMEPVGLCAQILQCGVLALRLLKIPKGFYDGSACFPRLDQPSHCCRLLPQTGFYLWLEVDLLQVLGQAPVVIIVRLGHSPAIEALRDDRIGDSQSEQFGVLEVAKAVWPNAQRAVFIAFSVCLEQGQV